MNFQDNVQELLIAGDMIELQEVVQLCTDYLLDQVRAAPFTKIRPYKEMSA